MVSGRGRRDDSEWELPVEVAEEADPEVVPVEQAQAPAPDHGEPVPAGVGGSFVKRDGQRYRR